MEVVTSLSYYNSAIGCGGGEACSLEYNFTDSVPDSCVGTVIN